VNGIYETDLPAVERRFAALPIDRPVKLDVLRGAETLAVTISAASKGKQEGEDFECKKWDLTVKEITKFSDPYLHFQKARGVFVQGVKFQGNARTAGFANFDVILAIGDRPIESLKEVREAYEAFRQKRKPVFT
jgi:hypothetical protein